MKNKLNVLFVALAAIGITEGAVGQEHVTSTFENGYITIGADFAWTENAKYKVLTEGGTKLSEVRGHNKPGFGGHFAIGYKLEKLRTEIEGVFLSGRIKNLQYIHATDSLLNRDTNHSDRVRRTGIFVNAYFDHDFSESVAFYLGVGLGAVHNRASLVDSNGAKMTAVKKWTPGVQGKAGLTFYLNENVGFNVGYRVLLTTKPKFKAQIAAQTVKISPTNHPVTHGVEAGITYHF